MTETTPTQNLMKYLKDAHTAIDAGWYSIAKECLTKTIDTIHSLNNEVKYFINDHPYDIDMQYKVDYVLNDGSPYMEV